MINFTLLTYLQLKNEYGFNTKIMIRDEEINK